MNLSYFKKSNKLSNFHSIKSVYFLFIFFLFALFLSCKNQKKINHPTLEKPSSKEIIQQFNNPPTEYSLTFYWGWDGNVSEDVIARDLDEFKTKNVHIVTLEPGYGMPYKYLSSGWFDAVKKAVGMAKERNMKVYLVDEGKYPSGFAGGKFSQLAPELCMKALVSADTLFVADGETISLDLSDDIISAVAYNKTKSITHIPEIIDKKLSWTAPAGKWEILLVKHDFRSSNTRSVNNPSRRKDTSHSLFDYLDKEATLKFLEFTHQEYKKAVGEEFGKTVLGFRGDEPDYSVRGLPWTPKLFSEFEKQKAYDVRPYVASFFMKDLTVVQKKAKADYWDVWSNLFANNFFKVQADWCAANNVNYLVHLNHEENMTELIRSEGDYFRAMRSVQMPGIDAIWHQIWPSEANPVYPKYASSASHLSGNPRSFTESFAAYRPRPNLVQAKWIIDQQLVRGINMVEIMFVPTSSDGKSGMRGWLADERFPQVAKYIHRSCFMLSQGIPASKLAFLFPTSSIWLGDNEKDQIAQTLMQELLDNQHDFDVIDEKSLESILILDGDKFINRSGQVYSTIVIPPIAAISEKAIQRLNSFEKSGGKLIYLGKPSVLAISKSFMEASEVELNWTVNESSDNTLSSLIKALPSSDFELKEPCKSIKYTHRKWKDADMYFIFNESDDHQNLNVSLEGKGKVQIWNAITGKITNISGEAKNDTYIETKLNLAPLETKFIVIRQD